MDGTGALPVMESMFRSKVIEDKAGTAHGGDVKTSPAWRKPGENHAVGAWKYRTGKQAYPRY